MEETLCSDLGLDQGGDLQGDTVVAYLREIGRVPLLTAEEELQLGKAVRRGGAALQALQRHGLASAKQGLLWRLVLEGQQAQLKMVEANLRLVISVAKKYANQGIPFADLIQEGNLGLLKAVHKYDYRLQYRFSTYATCWVRQTISRALAEHAHAIRLPAHVAESWGTVRSISRQLQQKLGRDPSLDELVLELGTFTEPERSEVEALAQTHAPLPPHLLRRLLRARARLQLLLDSVMEPVSLEAPIGEEEGELGDLLADGEAPSPADEALAQVLQTALAETLSSLSPREQTVLRYRFGLGDVDVLTLEELGERLGVTRERVRQIEQRALCKLRLSVGNQQLMPYLTA